MLGFTLKTVVVQSVTTGERSLVHCCCCEKGKLLSNPVDDTKMKIHYISNMKTVDGIIRKLSGPADVFFYCSPCTGGSAWQRLNLELEKKRNWAETVVKLIVHWDFPWRLWGRFEQVVKHCPKVGADQSFSSGSVLVNTGTRR